VTARPATAAMVGARRQDSQAKRARVLTTLNRMLDDGTPITFASAARQAAVSTWLVYAPGVREAVTEAQARQHTSPPSAAPARPQAHALATDLALAHAEITRLRAEHTGHQQQLRKALGARLDNLAKADLLTRISELTRHNSELAALLAAARTDNDHLRQQASELQDDLTAARTSLRRMIRGETPTPRPA
jgi:FtsZ-binding cell division protein ZapB